ncbi:MAG: response regulator, partial [Phycisphaerales bacterium]|nr:response regulator [Phycisphaerales bacterium]
MRPDEFNSDESTPLVLVIDDSPDVHRLLKARLRTEDLRLAHAEDGDDGIELCRTLQPALVLLDIEMPKMDGFEVLRSIKDDPALHHVPVIILSALQSPQDKVMAFDLGAVDYICKPFDFTELRARVRSALHTHQLLQLLAQRAQIDGLTGLWNRAHFDGRFSEALAASQRRSTPRSLAMLDIDHFK